MAECGILAQEYIKRTQVFNPVESVELKESQAENYLQKLAPSTKLVLMDEKGKEFTSKKLSTQINDWLGDPGVKSIAFVIGGPYGFSETIKKMPHTSFTLSSLTFQGDLAWVILSEQIYRAFTILKGMDYHHQ